MKTDTILLADVFENFIKTPSKENGINPCFCVSISRYTYQCGLKKLVIIYKYYKKKI